MSAVSPGRLLDDLAEVLAEAVVDHAALDGDAGLLDLLEDVRVVRLRVDRLGQVLADLVLVDVEGGHELDVADVIAAEVDVHQPRDEVVVVGVLVVVAALDEAARAVADADDRDADLAVAAAAGARPGVGRRHAVLAVAPFLLTWFSVAPGLAWAGVVGGGLLLAWLRTWRIRWMTVMVAPMAMIAEGDQQDEPAVGCRPRMLAGRPRSGTSAGMRPRLRMTRRISRGMTPTAAMPVPG